jgi:hypothetical protein
MRFSIIAAAFMATVAYAGESTVYTTEEITITSCAPTVTNCPARSTVTSTTSYAVVTSVPTYSNSSTIATSAVPKASSTAAGVASSPAPILSTITISESHPTGIRAMASLVLILSIGTCVPTVIYSTVTVTPVTTKAAPSSTGTISYAHNAT